MASIVRTPQGRWKARYRTPTGEGRSKTFTTKQDATRFLSLVGAARDDGLVLPNKASRQVASSSFISAHWKPAKEATGLDGLRFHDLRHTAVALAIAQGAHPKAIQARMGHSS